MTETFDVVISGAGPNGLMLACELALAGVRPVVIDLQPGPSAEPKANGLVGQIIRQLDMRGLYQTFSGDTEPPEPIREWMFAGMSVDLLGVDPNPMHALLVPQPQLVRLLHERAIELGVDVRWGHELVDFESTPDGVAVVVNSAGGHLRLETAYLVGADGGRSVVRKTAGIDFPGSTSDMVARIAHVHLPDEMRTADGGYEVPGFGRLPFGHTRLERGGIVFAAFDPDRLMFGTIEFGRTEPLDGTPMTLDELRRSAARVLGVDVPLQEPRTAGPHALRRIDGQNTRLAAKYRAGNVFLLGDAAHVHSAMGGPGLNLGMADTVNLGWKLAAQVNGWAPPGLLDTYESERRPVGERVMMQSLSQMALMSPGPEVGALRALFGELLTLPGVGAHMGNLLAGSDVRYDVEGDHPLSGYMVPDLVLDDRRRVADMLHAARPVLLDLTGDLDVEHHRVDVVVGTMVDHPAAALLIRPDGYVAWAADDVDGPHQVALQAALQRWFGAATEVRGQARVARMQTVT